MNIEMTTITPPMATLFLANNVSNRKLNKHHVDFLADQMLTGKWQKNGQTIVIADVKKYSNTYNTYINW